MTARAETGTGLFALPPLREVGLWTAAAAFVVFAHVAIAYTIQALRPLDPPVEANEPALMIDLAPIFFSTPEAVEVEPVSKEVAQETVEPVDDVQETVEEQVETAELEKPVEPETAEPLLVEPETVEPEVAEPEIAEPELTAPEVTAPEVTAPEVTEVMPEVVAALPEPRPIIEEPQEKKPVRKAEPRKQVEKPAPKKEVAKAELKAKPAARASVASRAAKAPSISPARWQSRLSAWLNRHKRYPRGAKSRGEEGVVSVSFAINEAGVVLSARISRSSGNSELDQAALDMLHRASPVPPPPPGVSGKIAVPVQFNLR
jgi:periplasmic protein TonB